MGRSARSRGSSCRAAAVTLEEQEMAAEALVSQFESQRRKVDFDTFDILVQQLTTMVESSSIDVAPAYQRQFRWDKQKRSLLIESVFLGIPIPSLFMATNRDGTWEVVDGVQRLCTLVQYSGNPQARARLSLDEPLILGGMEKLSELNGLGFSDIPGSLQVKFFHRPIKVVTLSDKSDMTVRFDLFGRLNTGGVALSNQEIRSCIFRGEFCDFLRRMAANEVFRRMVRLNKTQETDGTREECVLRFFAYFHRYARFAHSEILFLNEYMRDASRSFDYAAGEKIFAGTFERLAAVLPNGITRTPTAKSTPLGLFEGVSVGAALAIEKNGTIQDDTSEWLHSKELKKLTAGATNNKSMVTGRIEFCRDRFLGI